MSYQKYGAKPTTVDNIRFASQAEARRYGELKLLEKAGEIHGLELQPKFPLHTGHGSDITLIGLYIADFRYRAGPTGILHIEDVKSPATRTPIYRWKKKHTEAQYRIEITEVMSGRR